MSWAEIAVVFFVCHAVGDYLLQTDWQAVHKRGGLGHNVIARRALLSHVATYMIAYVPALIWLAGNIGLWTLLIAGLIALPHLVLDDRRLVETYMRTIKHHDPNQGFAVSLLVDQGFHLIALFLVALLAHSLS